MSTGTSQVIRVLVFFATNNLSGPGKGLFQLLENIDCNQVEFTVCNFKHPRQETFEFLDVAREKSIDIRLITQRWALDSSMVSQAISIAEDGSYDLVQSHGYKTHILAYLVSRRLRLPWLALSHGWTSENLKIKIYNFIERVMLRFADSAIGVSPDLYSEAARLRGARRTRQILNAIDDHDEPVRVRRTELRHQIGLREADFVIGVFGRLSFEKGQDQLLEAVSRMTGTAQIKVLILGEGNAAHRLQQLAADLEIENRVLFNGYQSNIVDYYHAIDVCVLPSRSEGLPNVVLEAHKNACPVIAFDVGGVGQTISNGETGCLIEPGNIDGLAEKIEWASENQEELRQMANTARGKLFPKFSIDRRCRQFLDEYRVLTAGNEESALR